MRVEVAGRSMVPVPIPGHSVTHTAFHEPSTGVVLVGDLFVSPGVTAVMTHENPFASIDSLRRVAALSPSRMLTGHGLIVEDPAAALGEKADRIEEAARGVLEMHGRGLSEGAIVRRTFRGGWSKDLNLRIATQGEFHRRNFVRACIRHAPGEVS